MQIELTEVQAEIVKYALVNESSRLDACMPDLFTQSGRDGCNERKAQVADIFNKLVIKVK